jgi:hypothetical protein
MDGWWGACASLSCTESAVAIVLVVRLLLDSRIGVGSDKL